MATSAMWAALLLDLVWRTLRHRQASRMDSSLPCAACAGRLPTRCRARVQLAARETGLGVVEAYLHAGKLLALELVVQLLENPLQARGPRV